MRRLVGLVLGVWLAGCTADLGRYYTAETGERFPRTEHVAIVDAGTDADAVYKKDYQGPDFQRLGHVAYSGPAFDTAELADLGRSVGADVAIVGRRYLTSRVVERDRYGGDSGTQYGMSPSSGPGFSPGSTGQELPVESYVVREFRYSVIFVRRATRS